MIAQKCKTASAASRARVSAFAAGLLFCASAAADGDCPAVKMGAEGQRKGAQLAAKVLAHLRTTGAKVALLGRAGSDAPQKRFAEKIGVWNYTHAGLAYRDHPAGEWTVVHLLNICGEQSGVFEESFLNFYLDDPHEYRAVAAVPAAPLQNALEDLIVRRRAADGYGGAAYSSISHPFSLARQNSNEYILDTIAAALALAEDGEAPLSRAAAKEWLLSSAQRAAFAPEIIAVGFFEALGAQFGFGPDNATLSDHTPAERAAGRYEFVSVGALIQFLDNLEMLQSAEEFALADISRARDTVVEQ